MTPTLLVLLKYPAAGRVKTRLADSVGAKRAADLYRRWIGHVFAQLQPLRENIRVVGCFDGAPLAAFAAWHPLADQWWPQPDGDLGTRLAAAFARAHSLGQPVAAIGTDCLELDAATIGEAFDRLATHDVVFGPTPDGGYYLVGTARNLPGFFDGIPWSSPDTLSTHLSMCERRGWTIAMLPTRRDIDTAEDWLSYCGASDVGGVSDADDASEFSVGGVSDADNASESSVLSASERPPTNHRLPTVAVVIPTLNEEALVATTLESVCSQAGAGVRWIVADGGSADATVAIARRFGAEVVESPRRGRGCQVASVVAKIQDDVVLVLHADTILPRHAIARLRRWMTDHPACPGGCLGHRFDSPRISHRLVEAMDAMRARWGVSYGDQAQFFRRERLASRGGFPDQPMMEDVELSRRLRGLGRPAYLDCPVLASARRLDRLGLWRCITANLMLRTAYRMGGTTVCERLYRLYYQQAVAGVFPPTTPMEVK